MIDIKLRVKLWDAINAYARACGGDTSSETISVPRMRAVTAVEHAVECALCRHQQRLPLLRLSKALTKLHEIYVDEHAGTCDADMPRWLSDALRIARALTHDAGSGELTCADPAECPDCAHGCEGDR